MAGCRVQQTCGAVRGASSRSREERQGRKASSVWQHSAEDNPWGRSGPDASGECRRRGVLWKTTRG